LLLGSLASMFALGLGLFRPDAVWLSPELTILSLGVGISALGLLSTQLFEILVPLVQKKTVR